MSEIKILDNGPLLVPTAGLELKDNEGGAYDLTGKESVALCRCGQSDNKPFCDGSHRAGFESKCRAPNG